MYVHVAVYLCALVLSLNKESCRMRRQILGLLFFKNIPTHSQNVWDHIEKYGIQTLLFL